MLPSRSTSHFVGLNDEVAVVHAPAADGYRALSDALVNMRFTFRRAARQGVIDAALAEYCSHIGEQLFYAERSYVAVLRRAARESAAVDALQRWLDDAGNRVDQKRADALELLGLLAAAPEIEPPRADRRPSFHFADTNAWNEFRRWFAGRRR